MAGTLSKIYSVDFKIVPPDQAVVSVMDRGFLYGDSVYEVVRTYRKTALFLADRHYKRLLRSAARIQLTIPFSLERFEAHAGECIARGGFAESYVRAVVSRGADDRFDLGHRAELKPTTVFIVTPVPVFPAQYYSEGIHASLVSIRRNSRAALDPDIKSGNYLNNAMALMEARKRGAVDAIMLNHEDFVTEATTSNVFTVKGGMLRTPKMESGILEGITRGLLKEIIAKEKIPFEETMIPRAEFLASDEIFISGTVKEIMPVTVLDGKPVGSGRPGPVTTRLMALFKQEAERLTR